MRKIVTLIAVLIFVSSGCTMKYSFTGASIDPNMKTVSVLSFPNNATMVAPSLSSTLYDVLTQKIQRETRLQLIREDGQANFEGEIIDYRSDPIAVSGNEIATKNRLTIAVKIKYTDSINEKNSFDRTFSEYGDYDSNQLLTSIEGTLIPEIVDKLVQNIFNEAFSNW